MSGDRRSQPGSLDPETACLVGVLRELRDRTGLSLTALAAQTASSRSSWHRYLAGTILPPRQEVEALARLAGEPADRPLALWQQAEARRSGRAAEAPTILRPP